MLDTLRLLREVLQVFAEPLEECRSHIALQGFLLSRVRLLDFLIWMHWNQSVNGGIFGKPLAEVRKTPTSSAARIMARERWEQTLHSLVQAPVSLEKETFSTNQ